MKTSSTNFSNYAWFILILILLGAGAAWLLNQAFSRFSIEVPFWIEVPGAIGFAAWLYTIFDKYLWAWPLFRWLGLIDFPDFRGRWTGELKSSFSSNEAPILAVLEIKQSASEVRANMYTKESMSSSLSAGISRGSDDVPVLRYGYLNTPEPFSVETMQMHYGSVELRLYKDKKKLLGKYFTSKERGTHGSLSFSYASKELLGRFDK